MQAPTMRRTVVDILKEQGKLTDAQLQDALRAQQATGQPIEQVLVDLGIVSEADMLAAQARLLNVQYVDLQKVRPDESAISVVLSKVPAAYLREKRCIPVRIEQNRLWVAMANPRDIPTIDELRLRTGLVIQPLLASPAQIQAALEELPTQTPAGGGMAGMAGAMMGARLGASPTMDVSQIVGQIDASRYGGETAEGPLAGQVARVDETELADQAPVIRLLDTILREAVRNEASDIHIEPQQNNVRVRFRIDGILHEVLRLPKWLAAPLVARVKILGDMDVAEKRVPQDGRMRIEMQKRRFDVRISTIPTVNGEKAVLRLLDQTSPDDRLGEIGVVGRRLGESGVPDEATLWDDFEHGTDGRLAKRRPNIPSCTASTPTRSTSSRLKTLWNTKSPASIKSMSTERQASPLRRRCAPSFAKTPTSSSSAKSATWRPPTSPSKPL
jgi:type IV pilus assembly protein PilB